MSKKKMYKLLSSVLYQGIQLPVGATCDFDALKPEDIAELEKTGTIIDVEKAIKALVGDDPIENAQKEADKIIDDAKVEAEKIIADAKKTIPLDPPLEKGDAKQGKDGK